jgi:hypothetical protein
MSKADKEKGPKPVEIAVAAVLSLVVGVLGAAAFLAFQEPEKAEKMPAEEDRVFGIVYYVPGSMGNQNHAAWAAKREAVIRGRSGTVPLVAEELNQWVAKEYPNKESAGDKPVLHVSPGTPTFRIDEGAFNIMIPLEWSVFGMSHEFRSQAWGDFVQKKGVYSFDAARVYIGSMPVPNVFGMSASVVRKVLGGFDISEDLYAGWSSLESVSVKDDTRQLVIP